MPRAIFLDDGGVMSDNALRGPQWQRLVGAFFVPRLGGAPEAWAEANRVVAEALFAGFDALLELNPAYPEFERDYNRRWLLPMCTQVGVAPPPDEQIDSLCREATGWITGRVQAAFPGVVETVRWLYANGWRLFTASGEDSLSLDGYLRAMGVRDVFGARLYGPDLLGAMKSGRRYYEQLFADAEVDPAEALVVDDSLKAVGWARAAGAQTLHVGSEMSRLANLPSALAEPVRS